jgi:hypothetical protein
VPTAASKRAPYGQPGEDRVNYRRYRDRDRRWAGTIELAIPRLRLGFKVAGCLAYGGMRRSDGRHGDDPGYDASVADRGRVR